MVSRRNTAYCSRTLEEQKACLESLREMAEKAKSDHTESDLFCDLPKEDKKKKKSKKDKHKRNDNIHRTQLKKDLIEDKNKPKKSKRKKNKKKVSVALALEDCSHNAAIDIFPQSSIGPKLAVGYGFQKQDHVPLVIESVKAPKKKKKVNFDLFPHSIPAKRSKEYCTSTTKHKAKDGCPWESSKSGIDINFSGTPQGKAEENRTEHREDNSPSDAEDTNSEDLFLTQRKFRVLPSSDHSSSGDHGDADAKTVPRFTNSPLQPKKGPLFSKSTSEEATQTENFFTSEISTSLRFHRVSGSSECSEQPTDLSLPNRIRAEPGMRSLPSLKPGKYEETSPTLGQKSTDTSSEENDPFGQGKSQTKAVQMRLNESFFFKMKGDGQYPRPQSPLMKLTQSRNGKKTKK